MDYEIMAADLGPENCMPDIGNVEYIHAGYTLTSRIGEEDRRYIGKGMIQTLLPYTIQDNYDRDQKTRIFKAAVLENSRLKAVFLPQLGGRLWSLYHKELQRELLYVNPVFQPGNLALRNAWFSGGVEWNIGIKGHNPLTCSPMYACRMENGHGEPYLRMYEYERIRSVVYSMDFYLPVDSDVLYMKTCVENTSDEEKYMYWWSNIAVPEREKTRVIAPCSDAFLSHYSENSYLVDVVNIPFAEENVDSSYPKSAMRSKDYFYRLKKEQKKWISAVDEDGIGLLEFSTDELTGRKMFVWGQGQGGKNWSRWLSGKPEPYLEIQAGLAKTQLEHIPMKAHSKMTWVEGFTAVICDPQKIHGEYPAAVKEVEDYLNDFMPDAKQMHGIFEEIHFSKIEQYGSGWGYAENRLRKLSGREKISETLNFPEQAVTKAERIWIDFWENGYMKEDSLQKPPQSFYTDPLLIPMFKKQIYDGKANAGMYLQFGVTLYANGRVKEAYEAFEKSNECRQNPWAWRNLAMIEKNIYHSPQQALFCMEKAIGQNTVCRGLMVDCAQVMLYAGAYQKWLEVFDSLNESLKADGRLRLYQAIALMETKAYEEAAGIINSNFLLCDIKEGEVSVSHIWEQLYRKLLQKEFPDMPEEKIGLMQEERYTLPAHLDFRMDR